jgi:DNA-cytosine methyltransferase
MNKEDGIVVLSCFDGMSGGQIALERAGIKVRKYYASEIDKYAMTITQKNYPDTIQLGDIQNWQEWDIETPDLIIAGSPCQGFSNAGHGLNFDDPRSKLFFTFKDILFYWVDKNPKLKWMLENVKMKQIWRDVITDVMGVEPVLINSALVSAQNRQRLYWANWDIPQPEDKGIFLKDIVQQDIEIEEQFIYSKTHAGHPKELHQKAGCLTAGAHSGGNHSDMTLLKYPIQGAAIRNQVTKRGVEEQLNIRKDGKSNAVVPSYPAKLNGMVFVGGVGDKDWAKDGKKLSRNYPQGRRIYSDEGKAASLSAQGVGSIGGHTGIYQIKVKSLKHGWMPEKIVKSEKYPPLAAQSPDTKYKVSTDDGYTYRKLTPLECERLQTVPEGYTEGVSNTQRYKMLGNGWTVDVIAHIFSHMS